GQGHSDITRRQMDCNRGPQGFGAGMRAFGFDLNGTAGTLCTNVLSPPRRHCQACHGEYDEEVLFRRHGDGSLSSICKGCELEALPDEVLADEQALIRELKGTGIDALDIRMVRGFKARQRMARGGAAR